MNCLLRELCRVKRGQKDSDFWLKEDGKPTRDFDPTLIGIKVTRKDVLVPDYAYYAMEYLTMQGKWNTDKLTVENVNNIEVSS